jgi:hypothetical protein
LQLKTPKQEEKTTAFATFTAAAGGIGIGPGGPAAKPAQRKRS